MSEQFVGNWKRQFLEGGRTGVEAGKSKPLSREQQLEAEVADLTQALGEAHLEARVWKRSAEAHQREGTTTKGPWPRPARESVRESARRHALAHPGWGHRKVWAMLRHEGHACSQATVLGLLRDEGLILPAAYQREPRQLAKRHKAVFAAEPSGPNQVWQLDFSPVSRPPLGLQ